MSSDPIRSRSRQQRRSREDRRRLARSIPLLVIGAAVVAAVVWLGLQSGPLDETPRPLPTTTTLSPTR